jgi:putative SOS response-associated peptidase YedK
MCGRARLSSDVSEIKLVFRIPPERPTPNITPSWNVAPTDPLPIVHYDAKPGARSLDVMRWGLIPYWAKDIKISFSTINARADDIENQTGIPRGVPAPALPGAARQFLRMVDEKKPRPANSLMRSRWRTGS